MLHVSKWAVWLQEATEVAPTGREVAMAKSETLNSFVFNFASTNAQMQRVAAYALLGIPEVRSDVDSQLCSVKQAIQECCCAGQLRCWRLICRSTRHNHILEINPGLISACLANAPAEKSARLVGLPGRRLHPADTADSAAGLPLHLQERD